MVYLAAHSFFNPLGIVSASSAKAVFIGFSVLFFLYAKKKGKNRISYPSQSYKLLVWGIFIASIMGAIFHDQSYMVSVVAVMPYLMGYLFFYSVLLLNPSPEKLEKSFQILTICSLLMYLSNLISFPNMIFGESQDEYDMSRGFVRIGIPMIEIVVTYFFYSINQWIVTKQRKNIYWILLTAVMIFMSLTRQVIALSAILGLLFVMQTASWFKKISVIAICIFVVYVVLPQIPMVKTMMELSEKQAINNRSDEDIRVTAWRFYTTEFQTNKLSPILGNGVPSYGKSRWGNFVEQTTALYEDGGNACFTVDVGWAGFFWYFGGVATLGLLLMFWKGIRIKKNKDRQYLTYSLAFIALTAIASGPILYYSQICSLSLILYMAYASKENRNSHPQL